MGVLDIISGGPKKPKKATKKAPAKKATTSSRKSSSPRKRKSASGDPGEVSSRSTSSKQAKRATPPSRPPATDGAEQAVTSAPSTDRILPTQSREQNLTLPKGFAGMEVKFSGMTPTTAGGKRLYKGHRFTIEGAIAFQDYAKRWTVMFRLKHIEKDCFTIKSFPEGIANAKHRNFRKVAEAMLKHAKLT